MDESGISSSFKFESYKIDFIHFEIQKTLQLLSLTGGINPDAWHFSVNIASPLFSKSHNKYISSIKTGLMLMPSTTADSQQTKIEPLVICELTTTGLFAVDAGRFDEKLEKNVIKIQFPALLLPYARSAITSILANAGFGVPVVLPLINMHEVAKSIQGELEIIIID